MLVAVRKGRKKFLTKRLFLVKATYFLENFLKHCPNTYFNKFCHHITLNITVEMIAEELLEDLQLIPFGSQVSFFQSQHRENLLLAQSFPNTIICERLVVFIRYCVFLNIVLLFRFRDVGAKKSRENVLYTQFLDHNAIIDQFL